MEFQLVPLTDADQSFLRELYTEVYAPEFAPLQLPAEALTQLLDMQFRAQTMGFASQFPQATHTILWAGDERIGRILVDRNDREIRLIDIALLSRFRSQGAGARILQSLAEQARTRSLPLRLTVRFDNPARRLYEREGFVLTNEGDGLHLQMEYNASASTRSDEPEAEPELVGESASYFKTLLGQTLLAHTPGQDTPVPLKLFAIEPLAAAHLLHNAGVRQGSSFVLRFHGPLSPILPNDTLDLETEAGERFPLFLSPIGQDQEATEYNAIFNRMG